MRCGRLTKPPRADSGVRGERISDERGVDDAEVGEAKEGAVCDKPVTGGVIVI